MSVALNHPPTAVGGIRISEVVFVMSVALNHPPTAVGRIPNFWREAGNGVSLTCAHV